MSNSDLSRPHVYQPGDSKRTLLLLHGTGGDEYDLLRLGAALDPKAHLLSPRGMYLEAGMKRFFERYPDGSFNETSIDDAVSELEGFIGAAQRLDLEGLIALLAEQVEMYSDGGGKVEALPRMLSGASEVARFFVTIFGRFRDKGTALRIQPQRFNGSLGILIFENDTLATALTIETDADRISHIYAVRNPDKLGGVAGRV